MRISDWSSDVCSSDLQAVKRGLQLGVSENFYIHRFGSFGPCIKKIECRQFLGSIVFRGQRQFVQAPSDILREHCEVGEVAILNHFLDADRKSTRLKSSH